MDWETLIETSARCTDCALCKRRRNVVFGTGDRAADLMFIGEGPGEQEDLQAEPFVGPAGKLFTRMLNAIGLTRDEVYIANIVKCRPPGNRDPLEEERAACAKYLEGQIALVAPKIIVCLGRVAAQALLDKEFRITKQRGQWFDRDGISYIATYHPSALLRDERTKMPSWEDFKMIRDELRKRNVE